jgi:cellulose synthase/poly-beta-1,6-N-acetylglucosamine synthase-like glycosyltransferase
VEGVQDGQRDQLLTEASGPLIVSTPDLPRVSFLLFAYNQEQYVEAAVAAAFAQDYPNLEIILSDDRSKDRTFGIMQAMAAAYRGPHDVRVNQTRENRGVLAHLYEVAGLASGTYLVGAAGDDLSYPQRASRLAAAFVESGADAAFSAYDIMDESGRVTEANVRPGEGADEVSRFFPAGGARQIMGVSSAYSGEVFEAIPRPAEPLMAEDYFFSLMLGLCSRRVAFVEEPLVRYRVHTGSLTNADARRVSLADFERKVSESSRMTAAVLRCFERAVVSGEGVSPGFGTRAPVDVERLRGDIRFHEFRGRWREASVWQRKRFFVGLRDPEQRRWLAPRLFGLRALALIKKFLRQ